MFQFILAVVDSLLDGVEHTVPKGVLRLVRVESTVRVEHRVFVGLWASAENVGEVFTQFFCLVSKLQFLLCFHLIEFLQLVKLSPGSSLRPLNLGEIRQQFVVPRLRRIKLLHVEKEILPFVDFWVHAFIRFNLLTFR